MYASNGATHEQTSGGAEVPHLPRSTHISRMQPCSVQYEFVPECVSWCCLTHKLLYAAKKLWVDRRRPDVRPSICLPQLLTIYNNSI